VAVTTASVVVAATACSSGSSPTRADRAERASSCAPVFDWDIARSWRLITLDDLVKVGRGGTLKIKAKPYEPLTSAVSVTGGRNAPTDSEVLTALRARTGAQLAAPGTSTSGLARRADVTFREKAAEAVYFQGLRTVTATYRYRCTAKGAGPDRGTGRVTTWDQESVTFGLLDCLAPKRENPDSVPAELALGKRCPRDSPAALSRP
jgi:hypothetical protein